ncbi:MAG: hypothetical protein ACTHKQ_20155 [Mesorhizobium sp.]
MSKRALISVSLSVAEPHGWIYDYQTLLTGILAVVAALASGGLLWCQIRQERASREDERCRKLRAARVALPATLSELCRYAVLSAQAVNSQFPAAYRQFPGDWQEGASVNLDPIDVPFPEEALRSLERVLEFVDDEAVIGRIGSIFREIQVLDTRLRAGCEGVTITVSYLRALLLEAAALYARAESLFGFARNQRETIDDDDLWDRTEAALHIMRISDEAVAERARQQRVLGNAPGEGEADPI